LLVTSAKLVGGVSIVGLNLWIARELPPAGYGVFAVAVTVLLLVDGVAGAALDAAVIGSFGTQPNLAATGTERAALLAKIAMGLIGTVLLTASVALVAGADAAGICASVLAGATGLLVHRSTLVYLQLRQRFAHYAAIDLAQTAVRWLAVGCTLATGAVSASMLVAAYALASWVMTPFAWPVLKPRRTADDQDGAARSALWKRVRITLATTSVGAVVARLDLLLIAVIAGTREAGIFSAASTLALAPTWLGAYMAPAFSARILPYCREGRMARWLRDVQVVLLVLAAFGVTVGVLIGPTLMQHVLPATYNEAHGVFAVLLLAGAAGFVTFPVVLHTLLFLSPRTYLVIDLVTLPILVAAYVVAGRRAGALGFAWVTACAAVGKACVAQLVAVTAVQREQARLADYGDLSSAGVVR
jgi:O-antigen/teichoic acid export membrane protein